MLNPDLYDPPVEVEGENNGLREAIAERLWETRTKYMYPSKGWEDQSSQVKHGWREAADKVLSFMLDIGFVGPAGHPDPERFDRLSYAWNYEAHNWEILDGEGGYVALVNENADVELILAAPRMMTAIHALLAAIPGGHPAHDMPEVVELEMSLPEHSKPEPAPAEPAPYFPDAC